ncbi:hypothetical protein [Pseudoalteromonas piscicida]|uniref:Cysteine dioxygenase n=1 Tax=Pseudoalteromonas piscicida TaxID=43662 RepID=A0A2A5JU60_PSEO7|nr:hypothetical protein [Pseudoalteromonas piscicida]PCK32906.1 hypothetical protein CEX98_04770 [Pseudoalteromonas piscicida]
MQSSLDRIINDIKANWSGLNSSTTVTIRELLSELTESSQHEPWLESIMRERLAAKTLYRDPKYGFMLLVHAEDKGTYRPPHDHGAGWVFYAVQSGVMEMTTYKSITTANGKTHLVSRGKETLKAGDCRVFLPGDIHDTHCLTDDFIQYRLTSCDFKEEKRSGRMIQYVSEV